MEKNLVDAIATLGGVGVGTLFNYFVLKLSKWICLGIAIASFCFVYFIL